MEAVSAIDPESQGSAAAAVIGSWEGKKYRWSMMRVSALCANADNCLFAPFDMSRFDHPIDASFLPRVRFAPGEFESMQQQCAPHADQCVVTFEAVLEEVSVGPGAPPNLALSGGHVVSVHPRAEEEAFLSGATPAARANPNVRRAFLGRK